MNKVILLGRLTREPEIRYTQVNNSLVVKFTLAVNRRIANKNGEREADFINIIAWNKTAEFVSKYFNKGQQVAVVGRIQTRNYEDEQGQRHYITEVIAEEVHFAGNSKNDTKSNEDAFETNYIDNSDDDDLPF